ncbi:hypothetical protein DL89DRAFT_265078 [Linderina pennispora]|uniref:Uncharacterized protein n=1 Tax=Linderina pennispora TaxID=61395 RepID=A0A1Y1WHC6_9FUNG|nr:uncharacterized protein DL89DRAFT_265078 [Linderina pennispora]ORX72907.1 hypothetical protein DL89DRAFT_265078 [Linderina pennispora]
MIQSLAIFAADLWSLQALLALAVVAILGTLVSLCPQWLRACIVHMVAYQKDPAHSQAWEYHAYRLCPPLLPQFMISNLLEAAPAADSASISNSVGDSASRCADKDNICNTKDKAVSQTAQQESQIEQQPPDDLLLSDTDTPEDHAGDPDHGREYSTERLVEWSPLNDHPLFDHKDHRMYQPEPIGHRPSTDGMRPSTTSSWAIPTAEITHLKHRSPSTPCSLSMYSDSEFSLFSEPFVN